MFLNILICILAIVLLIYKSFAKSTDSAGLPPQVPWKLPLFGHLPYLGSFPCKKFLEWKKQYGPMYLINMGSFRTLIINDIKILKEASKPVFSDRPPLPTFANCNNGIAFNDYNGGEQRQFILKQIRIFGEKGSLVEEKLSEGLRELLDSFGKKAGKPVPMKRAFTSIVVNSVWGIFMGTTFSSDDPDLKNLISYTKTLVEMPGILASIGSFIPWFANMLPGITGVNKFVTAYNNLVRFNQEKIDETKKSHVKGQPKHILDAYLDLMHETTDQNSTFFPSRNVLPSAFGDILAASIETTSTAIEWAVLLLGKFPQVQKKLQDEIKSTVGDSSPNVRNRPNMPYTEAVITEVFRWSSLLPFAVPHYTKENAELCGFIIPKNTMLIQNTYGIHHDPEIWGDPEEFRPERFLDLDGKFKKCEHVVTFGHGRRVCLGESIGRDQVFLVITRLFQRFDVSFGKDNPSLEIDKFGFVIATKPYNAIFTERY